MRRSIPARRGPFVTLAGLAAGLLSLVGLAGLFGLTGCTASDHGSSAPTAVHPGTPATSRPTPSGNPTDIAAAAAIAAVQKLYTELNRSLATGRTVSYRMTFTAECRVCLTDARVTEAIHSRGERVVGGGYDLSAERVAYNTGRLVIVQGVLSEPALRLMKGSSVVARQAPLPPTSFTWRVKPVGGTWLVAAVEALK